MDHQSDEQTAEDRRNLMFGYWPVHPDDEASLLGLNVMIIVLRQIYSVLPDDLVPTVGNETARILQVARSKSHEGNWSSIINKKLGAMYDICPDWKEQARHQSFISLIESDLMIESFWARPCFHLYHNCVYYKPPDGDWSPHQKPASNLAIGKASLIRYTGELSLGHHISRIFSVRTMEPPGWHYLRFCKWPQLIRVHYTPASAPESAPGFHDLCHLTINARYLEKSSIDDTKVDFRSTANVRYKLIAVVRLRSNDEAIDLVRLYNRHHTTMQPPDDAKRFFSNDWKLGEPGSSYMMFYLRDMYHGRRVKAPREFSSEADPCTQRLRWFQESLSRPRDEDSARRLEPRPISDESTTSPPDSNPGSAPPPATQPKPIVPSSKAGTSSSSGFGQGNVSSFGAGKVSSFAAESSPADEEDNTAGIGTHVSNTFDPRTLSLKNDPNFRGRSESGSPSRRPAQPRRDDGPGNQGPGVYGAPPQRPAQPRRNDGPDNHRRSESRSPSRRPAQPRRDDSLEYHRRGQYRAPAQRPAGHRRDDGLDNQGPGGYGAPPQRPTQPRRDDGPDNHRRDYLDRPPAQAGSYQHGMHRREDQDRRDSQRYRDQGNQPWDDRDYHRRPYGYYEQDSRGYYEQSHQGWDDRGHRQGPRDYYDYGQQRWDNRDHDGYSPQDDRRRDNHREQYQPSRRG